MNHTLNFISKKNKRNIAIAATAAAATTGGVTAVIAAMFSGPVGWTILCSAVLLTVVVANKPVPHITTAVTINKPRVIEIEELQPKVKLLTKMETKLKSTLEKDVAKVIAKTRKNWNLQKPFLDAVQLYFLNRDDCVLFRHSIINAVDLAFRLSTRENITNLLAECNKDLTGSSVQYWKTCKVGTYDTGFFINTKGQLQEGDKSKSTIKGRFVITTNFDNFSQSDDYPKIMIAFHGVRFDSSHWRDFQTCLSFAHKKLVSRVDIPDFRDFPNGQSAHAGFIDAAASCYPEVVAKVREALGNRDISDVQIIVTGHSLGGAIASIISLVLLNAFRKSHSDLFIASSPKTIIAKELLKLANEKNNVVLLTMGQPRVWTMPGILFRWNVWAAGEDFVNIIRGYDVNSFMHTNNIYRIVTSKNGNNNALDFVSIDPVAASGTYGL
jgi:hypothetical protein